MGTLKHMDNEKIMLYDTSALSFKHLIKALYIKIYKKITNCLTGRKERMVWMPSAISDATGPGACVRNYLEMRTIRSIMSSVHSNHPISRACEVGCGYGRLTMVLNEFAGYTVGFEREPHLVCIAKELLPSIEFCKVESLDRLTAFKKGPFDFVMTCTVLQHLTDDLCRNVLEEVKRLSPKGHVLLIEKTEAIMTTKNTQDGDSFISRARPVETYSEWMKPYKLIFTSPRILEPTYSNPDPGTCMLFMSPLNDDKQKII